jgi:hypothetical protein
VTDVCCGEVQVQEEVQVQGMPTEAKAAEAPPTRSEKLPAPAKPEVDTVDNLTDLPAETAEPAPLPDGLEESTSDLAQPPAPDIDEPTIVEQPPADDSVAPLPADDSLDSLFDEPPAAAVPDAQPPAAEPPAAEPPADTGADNLFDAPPADLPADGTGADDLFTEPPRDEAPADDAADDLFSEPPATDTPSDGAESDDLFGAPPAGEMPSDDLDLFPSTPADSATDSTGFEETPPVDAAPSDQPDATEGIDDLFNSNTRAEPAAADDTLVEPAATEVEQQDTDDRTPDDLNDLFSRLPATPATEAAPATAATPAATSSSTQSVTRSAEALPFRLWVDNTGHYRTQGRLVNVTPTHVRLLKENGHFTTVDKTRLSAADLQYVQQITQQLGAEYFDQLARR